MTLSNVVSFLISFFVSGAGALAQGHDAHHGHHEAMGVAAPISSGSSLYQFTSTWKNQNGETLGLASFTGKPRLLAMVYSRCETACPLIVEDLKDVARDLSSKKPAVTVVSIDSERETPETLRAFAKKRNIPSDWTLLTGDANAISELAAALGVRYKRLPGGEYIHSNLIFFLNEKGEIVASKEGLKTPRKEFVKKVEAAK